MGSKSRRFQAMACSLILLGTNLLLSTGGAAQSDSVASRTLLVGVVVSPPAYQKTADNRWEGIGVELWHAVAQRMGVPYEFREYGSLGLMSEALENGEIDVIPSLPVAERLESGMDFSQSYLKSGLAIAVPGGGVERRWWRVFRTIFSKHILQAVALLLLMSILAGIVVWAFERRRNSDMFGGAGTEGIGHGIWWAMVTMTTVGYGDKAPKTMGGRITALVWMIFSIVFIAAFTADITTSLTISELKGKVSGFNDLYTSRVGALSRSEGFDYLKRRGIPVIAFDSAQQGLREVAGKRLDAFVLNEQMLKFEVKNDFAGRLVVLPGTYDEYFVSIALQQGSPFRKPINKALLKFMGTQAWVELMNRYLK